MKYHPSAIGDALFTKTQQRVFGILYGNPGESYYLNELVRLADIGKGTVRRELDKLCKVGLITLKKQGNQNHYQANAANPVYAELKGIVDKTFGVSAILQAALQPLMERVDFAFVYGSVAKGEEHAHSDIDLMLVTESLGYTTVMESLHEPEQSLGRKINPTLYSPVEFAQRLEQKQHFLSRVVTQRTLWLWGEERFYEQYGELIKRR